MSCSEFSLKQDDESILRHHKDVVAQFLGLGKATYDPHLPAIDHDDGDYDHHLPPCEATP